MKISETYSHLNGLECLIVHKPVLWNDICEILRGLSAECCLANPSGADRLSPRLDCTTSNLHREMQARFRENGFAVSPACPASLVRERVGIEIQIGKKASRTLELFARHMAFFVGDVIDVGVEILPMKELQQEMSSGVAYYEGELYNLIRQGRGVPAAPLVLIGIAP
ncbi:MAG: restriction endonuclease [Methylocystis sp.]|nr:restriction endonuclease [Methylocystis sp.]